MNVNNPNLIETKSRFAGKKITFKELLMDLPDGTVGVLREEHSATILNVILCSDGGFDLDLEGRAPVRYNKSIEKQIQEGLITIE
jgi:hypothetical protein